MDGPHDLGGATGYGPLDHSPDAPFKKDAWQARIIALTLAARYPESMTLDWMRHCIECLPPEVYLETGYHDRWHRGLAALFLTAGWISFEELAAGRVKTPMEDQGPPMNPDDVEILLQTGERSDRPAEGPPAFQVGDRVRSKSEFAPGHTRLPAYARGQEGVIEACYGWHLLADSNARGVTKAEPLYSVSFLARDLFDEVTAPKDRVHLDLWESYFAAP